MKLSKILFETSYQDFGPINAELAVEDLNRYRERGIKLFKYEPFVYAQSGAAGGFITKRSLGSSGLYFDIDSRKIIDMDSSLPTHNPRFVSQLESIIDAIPEFKDYQLVSRVYNEKNFGYDEEIYGKVSDLLSGKKSVVGRFPRYSKGQDLYDQFKFEVLQDITEVSWYHATRASNWDSIKSGGLLPSKTVSVEGWTEFNLDLQKAVYLTLKFRYAKQIAETLAERFGEPAIVLKINGQALADKSKIVVDEDVLRDEYTGNVTANQESIGMPEYILSLIKNNLSSIGYRGKIESGFVEIAATVDAPEIDAAN